MSYGLMGMRPWLSNAGCASKCGYAVGSTGVTLAAALRRGGTVATSRGIEVAMGRAHDGVCDGDDDSGDTADARADFAMRPVRNTLRSIVGKAFRSMRASVTIGMLQSVI